jgi:hypothetical protein
MNILRKNQKEMLVIKNTSNKLTTLLVCLLWFIMTEGKKKFWARYLSRSFQNWEIEKVNKIECSKPVRQLQKL